MAAYDLRGMEDGHFPALLMQDCYCDRKVPKTPVDGVLEMTWPSAEKVSLLPFFSSPKYTSPK